MKYMKYFAGEYDVDKIQQVETGSADRPKTDVKILKMKVVK